MSQTTKDTAIVATRCEYETLPNLSNRAISNNLERPQTQISRSRHYLTPNISETVRDTYIVTTKCYVETYALVKNVISNDLE